MCVFEPPPSGPDVVLCLAHKRGLAVPGSRRTFTVHPTRRSAETTGAGSISVPFVLRSIWSGCERLYVAFGSPVEPSLILTDRPGQSLTPPELPALAGGGPLLGPEGQTEP